MNTARGEAADARPRGGWITPALTLLLVAPLVGEVLNGATRLSYIFAFVPQVMVWGCGALLAREAAHRLRAGVAGTLALGLALSLVVELLVLQTSLAPIPYLALASIPAYDRIGGVNWLWLWFMLGYETVWIVLVPVLVTELAFPARRHEAWLGRRGLSVATLVFAAGCVGLWALWTQAAVPVAFGQPKYWPPRPTLLVSALAVSAFVAIARLLRDRHGEAGESSRPAPPPWSVGTAAVLLSLPWWALIVLVFVPRESLPLWIPLAGGAAWAVGAFAIVRRWSVARGWSDRHRWALAFGALVACMGAGYMGSHTWPAMDLVAKAVLNVVAVERMIALGRAVWRRDPPGSPVVRDGH
jgi:hypothetical protein